MYGRENVQTIETRIQLAELLIDVDQNEKAKEHFSSIDKTFEKLASSAAKEWPDGWQQFNARNRLFDVKLDRAENLKGIDAELAARELQKLESTILNHYDKLNDVDLNDGQLKNEMTQRSLAQIVRMYEYQENADKAEEWRHKLETAFSNNKN